MINSLMAPLNRKRASLNKEDQGFTLIELLVVVIIIGILAAIAIPIFLSQQNQAKDSAAKSDLGSAKVAYVSALVADPTATVTDAMLATQGFAPTIAGSVAIRTTATNFCIEAVSARSTTTIFSITGIGGVLQAACSTRATS